MNATFSTCPKCSHQRTPEQTVDPGTCPACGLVFAKWIARDSFVSPNSRQVSAEELENEPGLLARLVALPWHVPERVDPFYFWGRVAVLALMVLWGWKLAGYDYRDGAIANSFMHNILLPIHEAGHIIFMPFGEFMTTLGGSLFQILLPLIVGGTLLVQNRDPVGGALGLWWAGISIIDLAPYIYDAAAPELMLITGTTGADGPHDWIYLLQTVNRITYAHAWGRNAHTLGIIIAILAVAWAAVMLWRQKQRLAEGPVLPIE